MLLVLGGLETTSSAFGHMMLRFCADPELAAVPRRCPEMLPETLEELLRVDAPVVAIGRTATRDVQLRGRTIGKGEKLIVLWAAANHDDDEFPCPEVIDTDRAAKRHLTFGAGPHRCVGSNVARLLLRVGFTELLRRLDDIQLEADPETVPFHPAFTRAPEVVPIRFKVAV
jgi:cytochrome P450